MYSSDTIQIIPHGQTAARIPISKFTIDDHELNVEFFGLIDQTHLRKTYRQKYSGVLF